MAETVRHGTPEGFRLHKKLEQEPCPACRAAMDELLARVRGYQAAVRGSMPTIAPLQPFSTLQREWWPILRERDREPLPELPPVSMPKVRCAGDEHFLPRSVSGVAKKARAKGWWVSITRAAGPYINAHGAVVEGKEQVFTIAVAVARGDDRLIWVWKYTLKTVKGVQGWHWELDEVSWNKAGLINDTKGKAVLDA